MDIEGQEITISSEEKIYFPEDQITKGEVVEYYRRIAGNMMRHLENRPVMLHRYPEGVSKNGFYQKDISGNFPDWIDTVVVPKEDGMNHMVVVNRPATLVYLANQGTITFHTWMSQCKQLRKPDKIVFDLDPPDDRDFGLVKKGAVKLHDYLEKEMGAKTYLMTSGSKGLHIVVPVRIKENFEVVKKISRQIAEKVAQRNENIFTVEIRKDKRQGRLFVDYLRNEYQQTSVCAYSLRARKEAPIATPVRWEELSRLKSPRQFTIKNIFRRMSRIECCPWDDFHKNAVNIDSLI